MTKTLLVDGNNLFKIGYHGVREYYHKGNHIGGIYHFVNTFVNLFMTTIYDKVIVFWDGENNSIQRKKIFPEYKENRRYNSLMNSKSNHLNGNSKELKNILRKCLYVRL